MAQEPSLVRKKTHAQRDTCLAYTSCNGAVSIPAVRRPEIHNPTVVHLSQLLLHFCYHPCSAFIWLFLNLPVRK